MSSWIHQNLSLGVFWYEESISELSFYLSRRQDTVSWELMKEHHRFIACKTVWTSIATNETVTRRKPLKIRIEWAANRLIYRNLTSSNILLKERRPSEKSVFLYSKPHKMVRKTQKTVFRFSTHIYKSWGAMAKVSHPHDAGHWPFIPTAIEWQLKPETLLKQSKNNSYHFGN